MPQPEKAALSPATMKRGAPYNWRGQPDRLIYLGKRGNWHQFKKIGDPREVWCEVVDQDLRMLEETDCVESDLPAHGCGHMQGRGAA